MVHIILTGSNLTTASAYEHLCETLPVKDSEGKPKELVLVHVQPNNPVESKSMLRAHRVAYSDVRLEYPSENEIDKSTGNLILVPDVTGYELYIRTHPLIHKDKNGEEHFFTEIELVDEFLMISLPVYCDSPRRDKVSFVQYCFFLNPMERQYEMT